MVLSAELSLYPNSDNYAEVVISFCEELQNTPGLQVNVGVLSTQVTAEAPLFWHTIDMLSSKLWEKQQAVLHIKLARGPLKMEDLPSQFK